ncbi:MULTISPECIES: lipoprotein-releasing ABC transporter permease subunit [unclassified Methylophaga]|jgi:lipoprotein-releasing system permease protein|uniref:lipoprotein-releasing ABC transporter permease subunit n=1 Tax=unclassified Methylophaga TaxID=2629249 RepID=UPI000C92025F|nr:MULTISPECIES: lipoprotein-releasing ABC transporter permease subunit [unclassified Methylophaga]MAK66525.1 lipoprotein-releasing system transmembrane subunit LolC [Methylophaga sp.]MAY17218.1 lipoprotein-releasing system transmembrane subunit LolC [Methylophaga sp.]MBN45988.1 lipoprotein-releasing system transmembrane subunit LolC [Methylophaga sp.]HAO26404.1 lipoprotein-releasing ABC transporter permease subunit [Methylophaga sp.]HCD05525.1 lipoprotein-releasing ABC transporter permease su|tara:strand:+ start:16926 stop:18173 length:1248 start_codon:yes stop_codon:yes gene_type:complete
MFRPLSVYIGTRYTRAKRRNHFISFISMTSMLGVALGVAALITVLSVMNGFEKELRERILGMTSHAFVTGSGGTLSDWQKAEALIEGFPRVMSSAPFVEGQAMLNQGSRVRGTQIRGVDPALEPKVSSIGDKIIQGRFDSLQPGSYGIILGKDLAIAMGVGTGDKITVITPHVTPTPAGVIPRLKRLTVAGVFEIGMYEYDSALAIMNIEDAANLFRIPGKVTGLRLQLDDVYQAPRITRDLLQTLPAEYRAADWTYQHANFFRALKTEKTVMFVILMLIVAVAAFNIVSTLVMMVTDKYSDIAILRTLGMSPRGIMGIFMVQGIVIGLIGTLLGVIGGVILALNVSNIIAWIEMLLGYQFLPAEVYYISDLPSELNWNDVTVIGITAFVLSILSTIYPSWRAAQVKPAEALRYD